MYKQICKALFVAVVGLLSLNATNEKSEQKIQGSTFFSGVLNAGDFVASNIKPVRFLSCVFHIPGIVFLDSTNPTEIRLSTVSSMVADSIKLIHYLLAKKETRPVFELCWHMPKAGLYTLADFYELLSFLDAESVAHINEKCLQMPIKTKFSKINQSILLIAEAFLRFIVCIGVSLDSSCNSSVEVCIEEAADILELWRLFTRCSAYFKAQAYKAMSISGDVTHYESLQKDEDWEHTLLKMLRLKQLEVSANNVVVSA